MRALEDGRGFDGQVVLGHSNFVVLLISGLIVRVICFGNIL